MLYGEVTYVSKEQAWKEFAEQIGDPALLEAVDGNPLPASLRVKLKPELLSCRRDGGGGRARSASSPRSRTCATAASGCAGST